MAGFEEFGKLEVSHRTLHAIAAELVRLVQGGAGPVDIDACISKLQDASVQMLAQLTLLESIELATAYLGEGR